MTTAFWSALAGFFVGSLVGLTLDWLRSGASHRRQLRLLRSELRRLAGFNHKWHWSHERLPADDATPIPPRITSSYEHLLQEVDFWLTDEIRDDNTQQSLITIADGAIVLSRYVADVHDHMARGRAATSRAESNKLVRDAVSLALIYDRELDRWLEMVHSAQGDNARRLKVAQFLPQFWRVFRKPPVGENPKSLLPVGGTSERLPSS